MGRQSIAPYSPAPLPRLLEQAAFRWPDKEGILESDRSITFSELHTSSGKLAAALIQIGVTKGDFIALLAPNCIEFEVAFFGILKAGATVTTINSGYREREIADQLNTSGAKILIVHHSLVEVSELALTQVTSVATRVVMESKSGVPGSFWQIIEAQPQPVDSVELNPVEDLAALPFSSGTTGLQKGVMLTHANLHANVRQLLERPGEQSVIEHGDVLLVHLPLFHIYGMTVLQLVAIAVGASQVMMGRFDMEEMLLLIARHRVSALYTAPPVCLALSLTPLLEQYDVSSLRFVLSGAAPLSGELQTRVGQRLGCPVIQGYGLTETSPVTNFDYVDHRGKPGTIGPSLPDTEEKIVDLETGLTEVFPGELGELLIRGPQVMKGYYNQPDATAAAIDPDGWFHTGDIARMDEDGYVLIVDRKKELIKYKGFQVPPAELEGVLLEHPDIVDAAVIPKPHIEAGEIPKAFVVKRPGSTITRTEIMRYVAQHVATFKQIREVEFLDAIPKNASGKLLRRVLIDQDRSN